MDQSRSKEWLVPLTGVLFVVLAIVGFSIQGEPKSADDPVEEIVNWYIDNKDAVQIGAILATLGAIALVFFMGYLRKVLRAAEGEGGMLSALTLIGAAIFVVGITFDSTLLFATADKAEDIDPTAVQTLQALWDGDFLPIAAGVLIMMLSAGLSIVIHGALPKWLGWAAIVVAILSVAGPAFFIGLIGSALWIVVVSIMLSMRARSAPPAPGTP
jgi:Domain of unknown function (DUF4386)